MNASNDDKKLNKNSENGNQIPDELLSLQNSSDSLISIWNEVLYPSSDYLFEYLNTFQSKQLEILEEIQSTFDEKHKSIAQATNNILSDSYQIDIHWEELLDKIEDLYSPSGEVSKAFKNSGWPIAPSMPISFNGYLVELDRKGKAKQAWRRIMGYYHKDNFMAMRAMVKNWEGISNFNFRMLILYDALDAHCQEKYTLSIPTLLSQIEGILSEFAFKQGIKINYGSPNDVSKQVLKPQDGTVMFQAMSSRVLEICDQLYKYDKFEKELTKKPRNRKVTRHTILHGISTNYATPSLSLKLFLSLDFLSGLENGKDAQRMMNDDQNN